MSPRATVRKGAAEAAPSPSDAIVKTAAKTVVVTDELGRAITVRKYSPLLRMRFHELIGKDKNDVYTTMAALACAVIDIDGEKVSFPTSKRELEAAVQRLGDEGMEAAQSAMMELTGISLDENGDVVTTDRNAVQDAKNS